MTMRKTILGLLVAAIVGVGAYATSVATRPTSNPAIASDSATQTLMDWLQVPASQRVEIQQHDPAFAENLKSLREALADKRADLAVTLDDPDATDESIRAKLEALIVADANLERRVADYLLAVRHHLTKDQQRRLFGLCAEGIRQGPNGPWRQGPDGIGRGQGGQGRGLGPPAGRGPASTGGFRGGRGQE
ncbi:MAG: hypothetical protein NTU53_16325 [Planctomycetota bacterium]|nr:hypothetical protein [Planctomycetota bacterium]